MYNLSLASPLSCWPPGRSKSGQACAFVRYSTQVPRRCLDLLWSWDMRHGAWLESHRVGVSKNGGSPSHRLQYQNCYSMTTGWFGGTTILGTPICLTENIRKLWKIIMVNYRRIWKTHHVYWENMETRWENRREEIEFTGEKSCRTGCNLWSVECFS